VINASVFVYRGNRNDALDKLKFIAMAPLELRDEVGREVAKLNKEAQEAGLEFRYFYSIEEPVRVFTDHVAL
jgi:hypothetical protein